MKRVEILGKLYFLKQWNLFVVKEDAYVKHGD